MSSEFTFGDNSDEFTIFDFSRIWLTADRSDTDVALTTCTSGADKGTQTFHTQRVDLTDKENPTFQVLFGANKKILRSTQCESVE